LKLNTDRILTELKEERERLTRAIEALEGSNPDRNREQRAQNQPTAVATRGNGHRRLTTEQRKHLSEIMKKRWAARRKKGL
jgi:hypothetical protein